MDKGYSYSRVSSIQACRGSRVKWQFQMEFCFQCMENCFWENLQSKTDLPCINPSFLTKEVKVTKPKCKDLKQEREQYDALKSAYDRNIWLSADCKCPKRCNVTEYHIFIDSTSACQKEFGGDLKPGTAYLAFRFPARRVRPHFLSIMRIGYNEIHQSAIQNRVTQPYSWKRSSDKPIVILGQRERSRGTAI